MKIGLQVLRFDWPGSPANIGAKLAEIARAADQAGLDSFWVMDHYFQIEGRLGKAEAPMLEAYSALSYAAAVTERIRLGVLVAGVIYRHPGYLLKVASSLDVLSGGRAQFGIGAGWYEREARALGFPFPPLGQRFEQLEETLRIVKQAWAGEFRPFHGRHFHLEEPINSPQPLSKPHPPILIGGGGERKTLRLVAQYGDACGLWMGMPIDELSHKLSVLRQHCEEIGRDYGEIERTVDGALDLTPGGVTPAEAIEQIGALSEIGIQHVMLELSDVHDLRQVELLAREVLPAVRPL